MTVIPGPDVAEEQTDDPRYPPSRKLAEEMMKMTFTKEELRNHEIKVVKAHAKPERKPETDDTDEVARLEAECVDLGRQRDRLAGELDHVQAVLACKTKLLSLLRRGP